MWAEARSERVIPNRDGVALPGGLASPGDPVEERPKSRDRESNDERLSSIGKLLATTPHDRHHDADGRWRGQRDYRGQPSRDPERPRERSGVYDEDRRRSDRAARAHQLVPELSGSLSSSIERPGRCAKV